MFVFFRQNSVLWVGIRTPLVFNPPESSEINQPHLDPRASVKPILSMDTSLHGHGSCHLRWPGPHMGPDGGGVEALGVPGQGAGLRPGRPRQEAARVHARPADPQRCAEVDLESMHANFFSCFFPFKTRITVPDCHSERIIRAPDSPTVAEFESYQSVVNNLPLRSDAKLRHAFFSPCQGHRANPLAQARPCNSIPSTPPTHQNVFSRIIAFLHFPV